MNLWPCFYNRSDYLFILIGKAHNQGSEWFSKSSFAFRPQIFQLSVC